MQMREDYEQTSLKLRSHLNIKNLLIVPFITIVGLISSYVGIYSYYKDKDKTIYIYYIILIITLMLCNAIYILFSINKKQTATINKLNKQLKDIEVNRDALVNELNEKQSKLKKYENLYWDTKTFFLKAVRTIDNEERNDLLVMYTELNRRDENNE